MSRLEDCYAKGLLRKVEPSPEKARRSLGQSSIWLDEAKSIYEAGAFRSCLIAIYNAYFHAARSLLFRDGVREKSHYCIEVYLEQYVESGIIEAEWVSLFSRIRSLRHADQYGFGPQPSKEEMEMSLANAAGFINRIKRVLEETN